MNVKRAALEHTCQVLRRQFQEELSRLTLCFVVFDDNNCTKALMAKQAEIEEHPAGKDIFPLLQNMAETQRTSRFAGIGIAKGKGLSAAFISKKALAVFFIKLEEFKQKSDIKLRLHHLIWHAINLQHKLDAKAKGEIDDTTALLQPRADTLGTARQNMLGDVFAASMAEVNKKRSYYKLCDIRCRMALSAITGYKAELYPYPITMDATQIVFKDVMRDLPAKTPDIRKAIQITREIDDTYDDNALLQWQSFVTAAQEMAWLGYNLDEVLSTSVYTTEDPYVRAMAYLTAEVISLQPAPFPELRSHNPFTDPEANERGHIKKCKEIFAPLTKKIRDAEDASVLYDEAKSQIAELLKGQCYGWCAHALINAAGTIKQLDPEHDDLQTIAEESFLDTLPETGWQDLHRLSVLIMKYRRSGANLEISDLITICEDANLHIIARTIKEAA